MTAHAEATRERTDVVSRHREALERRLDQLLPIAAPGDRVGEAMREGVIVPGKRVRPLLLLLAGEDLGCRRDHGGLLDLACAVEMVHAASLILDDTPCMDDARWRRGRPTIHRRFGESVAVLAAVALLSHAFGVIARAPALNAQQRNDAVAALSAAVGQQGLVRGQFLDLSEGQGARSAEAIADANELKTTTLFSATLQLAAIAAQAGVSATQPLRDFSHHLGQAFQLMDDLADDRHDTGKDRHQDRGKSTLVALLGADAVRDRLRSHLQRALAHYADVCPTHALVPAFLEAGFERASAAPTSLAAVDPPRQPR